MQPQINDMERRLGIMQSVEPVLENAITDIGIFKAKALEIHSRRSQSQRTRTSEEFRTSQQAILFSSDVSARGMDYPDVSFVLQVSLPSDKAQYVHRLGRTARAGKSGQGMLLL